MLYLLAIVLLIFMVIAMIWNRPYLQATTFALYGMTCLMMAMAISSNWLPIFTFRFFLYVISGFSMLIIPFILMALAYLVISRSIDERERSLIRTVTGSVIAISIIWFLGLTLYQVYQLEVEPAQTIVSMYSLMALYFTLTFFSYMVLNLVIDLIPLTGSLDAILILGSQLDDFGEVSGTLRRRLNRGISLYQRHVAKYEEAPLIIVSGGYRNHDDFSEAEKMVAYLNQRGIPMTHLVAEAQAYNTYQNFEYVTQLLQQYGLGVRWAVVTSRFHLVRTHFIAHQLGLQPLLEGVGSPSYLWPFAIVREYVAYIILTREINFVIILFILLQDIMALLP